MSRHLFVTRTRNPLTGKLNPCPPGMVPRKPYAAELIMEWYKRTQPREFARSQREARRQAAAHLNRMLKRERQQKILVTAPLPYQRPGGVNPCPPGMVPRQPYASRYNVKDWFRDNQPKKYQRLKKMSDAEFEQFIEREGICKQRL